MTAAFADAGAGVAAEASGAALSPANPATVNANDLLFIHTMWEGTATAPSTPSGFTLLSGPNVSNGSNFRSWLFGKRADGTEDGAANALGSPAVTTMRAARVYRYTGAPTGGTITDIVGGFGHASATVTGVADVAVTTPETNCKALQFVAVNDDNAAGAMTGATGGTWALQTSYLQSATTPDSGLWLEDATVASAGTINGGNFNMSASDTWAIIGCYIRNTDPAAGETATAGVGTINVEGVAGSPASGMVTLTGGVGTINVQGVAGSPASGMVTVTAGVGTINVQGVAGEFEGLSVAAGVGTINLSGVAGSPASGMVTVTGGVGSINLAGVAGSPASGMPIVAANPGLILIQGIAAPTVVGMEFVTAVPGVIDLQGVAGTFPGVMEFVVAGVGSILLVPVPGTVPQVYRVVGPSTRQRRIIVS